MIILREFQNVVLNIGSVKKMSEKRFSRKSVEDLIVEKGLDSIVGLLNEISDKIDEQQSTITELKSIINFASNEGDLIVLLMKEIIKLRQEVQECRAYETIEKGVSNYD